MTLFAAILLALAAISASPETEAPTFALDVIAHCQPVAYDTFVGCEMPALGTEDEPGYAGWQWDVNEPFSPITGP